MDTHVPFDLASSAWGGKVVSASNEHYGPAAQIISPFPPLSMFDGLESARSREPGHFEEVTVQLGKAGVIDRIEIDFSFFVNNNPKELAVLALSVDSKDWVTLVPRTSVKAYAGSSIQFKIHSPAHYSHVKVIVYPDGGFNRLRVFGR